MKYIIIGGVVVAMAAVGSYVYVGQNESEVRSEVIVYTDSENKQFTVQRTASEAEILVSLSGVQYVLNRVETASEVRYESVDGNVVFVEDDSVTRVEIGGEVVFADAVISERRVEVLKSNKQGDPSANKYDLGVTLDNEESCNGVDDDCSGPETQMAAPGDPVPGIGITVEQGGSGELSNESNDIQTETADDSETVMESDTSVKATDYNSSRSNRSTSN